MFTASYFGKTYFSGWYFTPIDGDTPPVDQGRIVYAGFILNMGTMINR
jgi:hypothetical protein